MQSRTLDIGHTSVQTYLTMLEGVLARMATNSGNCKTWCVTLVSAVLVLGIDKDKPQACAVGLVPVLLFAYLDAYYLRLERGYRQTYNRFVQTLRQEESTDADIRDAQFTLAPTPGQESWFAPFVRRQKRPFT